MRRFNVIQKSAIPCYADERTLDDLRRTFSYIFNPPALGGGVPQITLFRIGGPFVLGALEIIPVPLLHGHRPILGFRIGDFAYLTDCSRIPDESWPLLEGVRTLVLDALRDRPHPTHFSVAEALEVVARLRPSGPTSRTSATTSRTPPPAPVCRRAWSWRMMGWFYRLDDDERRDR